jgi:ankyrin repeat protein
MNLYSGIGIPLQLAAAEKGFLDLVKLIVEKGADALIKDPRGQIALDRAVYGGYTDVVEFLRPLSISSGPRRDFVDEPGLHFEIILLDEFLKK